MPEKKSTRPASADQESGAADPSLIAGSGESSIEEGLDDLTSELSSGSALIRNPAAPKTAPASAPSKKSAPDPEPTEPAPERSKLSAVEFAALAMIGVIVLGFVVFLFTIPDGDLPTSDDQSRASTSVPSSAKGELLSLTSIDAYWRHLKDADRTDNTSGLLPELSLQVSQQNTSAPSFLKIYFLDPLGEISGDVRTARIEGGKLIETGRGESITGADQVSVYGSKGLKDEKAFLAYRYSNSQSWAVQVFEGADYSKGPWNTLAFFEIPNELRGKEAPSE